MRTITIKVARDRAGTDQVAFKAQVPETVADLIALSPRFGSEADVVAKAFKGSAVIPWQANFRADKDAKWTAAGAKAHFNKWLAETGRKVGKAARRNEILADKELSAEAKLAKLIEEDLLG